MIEPHAENSQAGDPQTEAAPAKVDPETLVLRGRPSPVIQLKRGVIIGIPALGASAGRPWPPDIGRSAKDGRRRWGTCGFGAMDCH